MTLQLSEELRAFVADEIRAGRYPNEGAAVSDALLRLMEDRERDAWLRARIDEGVASLQRGEGRPWDVEAAKQRLQASLAAEGERA